MRVKLFNLFAALCLLAVFACNNETKKEDVPAKEKAAKEEAKKTEVSVGPDGAEVKTKSGTEVKVGDSGVSVGTKDAKVDIKSKDDKQ
jgi:hypothetical protein